MFTYRKDKKGKGSVIPVISPVDGSVSHYIDRNNVSEGGSSVILGRNSIDKGFYSIVLGAYNEMTSVQTYANSVLGGLYNYIKANTSHYNTIVGGSSNEIKAGKSNFIAGGEANWVETGDFNFITGTQNTNNADVGGFMAGAYNHITEGLYQTIFGSSNEITLQSFKHGINFIAGTRNTISGGYQNAVFGAGHSQVGNNCLVIGQACINLDGSESASNVGTDARLVVGNGSIDANMNAVSRSNAFVVYHNGEVVAPTLTNAKIEAASEFVLTTKKYIKENYVKKPAGVYADNTAAKAGGLVVDDTYRTADGTLKIVF